MLKKLFNFFLLLFISLFFFLISDYFISKHTNLFHIKKDCFKYLRFKNNDKEYYSYELEKNCYAFENKGTTFAYKVVTNNLGHRIANKNLEKDLEKEKIIFLGE